MLKQHDRLDPESRAGLEELFKVLPGGFTTMAEVGERRAAIDKFAAQMNAAAPPNDRVHVEDRRIPGPQGAPEVTVRIYRPKAATQDKLPGLYYIHGGGMCLGNLETEHLAALTFCDALNAVVVAVDYRLAPEHPHPAPSEDCYAALCWMAENAANLAIDPARIAIYGGSAGGGLAIATALLTRDRRGPAPCFMAAIYPMIDDRNQTPSSHEVTEIGIWDRAANLEAWAWYLGGKEADQYAAPARCENLAGLPPTFIDVGEMDAFRDEDITFAARLMAARVPTELHVYPGAYHGSELFAPTAALSRRIMAARFAALQRALNGA